MTQSDDAWAAAWRAARPRPAVLHVDSAAAGRSSTAVLAAVADYARREATEGAYLTAERVAGEFATVRSHVATLTGVDPDGVVFVESAERALNTALHVSPFDRGDEVAVAPSEWGPNLHAFARAGLKRRVVAVDDRGVIDLDALQRSLMDSPPALVHVTQQASHRALRHPVRVIAGLCHGAGVPLWVDAAQAIGHCDVASGADVVYAPSRKWLTGPRGVGMLAIGADARRSLRLDGTPSPRPGTGPLDGIESHEAHVAGRVGLGVAINELLTVGVDVIGRRLDEVGRMVRERLADAPGWRLVDPVDSPGAISSVEPTSGQDVFAVRRRLIDEHSIVTTACATARAPLDMDRPSLRISPHVDVTPAEIDAVVAALAGFR